MLLPYRKKTRFAPPARAFAASLGQFAAAATWRALHPASRERYLDAPAPPPLVRKYYRTEDGWQAPVFYIEPRPGGSGEPVVLAHALGCSPDAFRYGTGPTIAATLSRAGFAVYLLAHRGDVDAIPPKPSTDFCFDDVVNHDLPAAMAVVREHSGFPRAFFVGHGLGGQLGLAFAARNAEDLAGLVALNAAVRFEAPRSGARRLAQLASLLPAHWRIPIRKLGPAVAPWIDERRDLASHVRPGTSSGSRLRGAAHHAVEDLPLGLLRQFERWWSTGRLVDRTGQFDYLEALKLASEGSLLVGVGAGDAVCPPESALEALDWWSGDREILEMPAHYGHLDSLHASDADKEVFGPVAQWLLERRRVCWERNVELRRSASR